MLYPEQVLMIVVVVAVAAAAAVGIIIAVRRNAPVRQLAWIRALDGEDHIVRREFDGEHHVFQLRGEMHKVPSIDTGYRTIRWPTDMGYRLSRVAWFTETKAGLFEVPEEEFRTNFDAAISDLCRHGIEELEPGQAVVKEAAVAPLARRLGIFSELVRSMLVEFAYNVEGMRGRIAFEEDWKKFVLRHKSGFAAMGLSFLLMGWYLGVNMMLDPRIAKVMSGETTSWVLLGMVVVSFVAAAFIMERK